MKTRFPYAVVGGTFDHFHKGHNKLLDEALSNAQHVTIGICTEKLYKDKLLSSEIESYTVRLEAVKKYITDKKFTSQVNFVPIDDIYGTTLEERNIDAIFVTEDNEHAADLINQKRVENGFPRLTVTVVPLVKGTDGKVISSERIRKGEIDRNGFAYISLFENTLQLPSQMRAMLRDPFGTIHQDINKMIAHVGKNTTVIAVGDIVTLLLVEAGHQASISVIDYKTRRHEINQDQKSILKQLSQYAATTTNNPSLIEKEAVLVMQRTINQSLNAIQKETIKILGEEDLLTLPAILFAPLGSLVIYGLFDQGAVVVDVTEEKKQQIASIVKQFSAVENT